MRIQVFLWSSIYLRAAAPEMISTSSLVMTAWRCRLYFSVSLSIISPVHTQTQLQIPYRWNSATVIARLRITNTFSHLFQVDLTNVYFYICHYTHDNHVFCIQIHWVSSVASNSFTLRIWLYRTAPLIPSVLQNITRFWTCHKAVYCFWLSHVSPPEIRGTVMLLFTDFTVTVNC